MVEGVESLNVVEGMYRIIDLRAGYLGIMLTQNQEDRVTLSYRGGRNRTIRTEVGRNHLHHINFQITI